MNARMASVRVSMLNLSDLSNLDYDIGDNLAKMQLELRKLKQDISFESKANFQLEKRIRALDQKIALLVRNRISLDEAEKEEKSEFSVGSKAGTITDERQKKLYESFFYLLQTEPKYLALLTKLIKTNEIDSLMQTVMFTLYGNQYDAREEHLLLYMFQLVLKDEFENCSGDGMGSLMRANTGLTRMMTQYARRGPGQSYLKITLSEPILKIAKTESINFEVNPMKVYEQMINDDEASSGLPSQLKRNITMEEAAENTRVQALIPPRMNSLIKSAVEFLDVIIASLDSIPYGIRWICKQISILAKKKFPAASRYELLSLQGGFFLLRFINPVVVTPSAFVIVETKLSPGAKRNFTYLAKLLQNLSNGMRFGGKEVYMEPANVFIDASRDKLAAFFDKMIDVADPETFLELEEMMALTKMSDPIIQITLNEIAFCHKLVKQHINTITAGEKDPLRRVIADLGDNIPDKFDKDHNDSITLHLFNKYDEENSNSNNNDGGGSSGGSSRGGKNNGNNAIDEVKNIQSSTANQTYIETKYMLFNLYRGLPTLKTKAAKDGLIKMLQEAQKNATLTKDTKLVQTSKKIIVNLSKLETAGLVHSEDNYENLRKEIESELGNLDVHKQQVSRDIESLKPVLQTIQTHSKYLSEQLQAYEIYLQSVRGKAYSSKDTKSKDKEKLIVHKFTHKELESLGVMLQSDVPEERRANVYFNISSKNLGEFSIHLFYKGKPGSIYEMEIKLDELLEMQHNNELILELEYFRLSVNFLIHLLKKTFIRK